MSALGWGWWHDPLLLLINALAAYRVTRLVLVDEVPPLPRVRDAIARRALARWRKRHPPYGADTTRDLYGDQPPVVTLLGCAWCSGWWVSVAVMVAATLAGPWWLLLAVPLALSAAVGVVAMLIERGE